MELLNCPPKRWILSLRPPFLQTTSFRYLKKVQRVKIIFEIHEKPSWMTKIKKIKTETFLVPNIELSCKIYCIFLLVVILLAAVNKARSVKAFPIELLKDSMMIYFFVIICSKNSKEHTTALKT